MAIEFVSIDTIVHDLLYIIRSGHVSQSETISDNQVEGWVHQYRALLIKQDLDKNKVVNPDYVQEIQCAKLIVVDKADDSTISTGRSLLKTELAIPKTIDLNFRSGFTYIGTLDGKEIDFVPQSRVRWQKEKYYTSNSPLAYLKNQHIYIDNDHVIEWLCIRGIFEQPQEVANFINPYTNLPEFGLDNKYPIPINMLTTLKEMILKKELGIFVNAPSDNKNDASNTTTPNERKEQSN